LPKYQLGFEAAELLLDRISGKSGPSVLRKLSLELRVRDSCGFKLFGSRGVNEAAEKVEAGR